MPGTPATTTRLGIQRKAGSDPVSIPADLNAIADTVDAKAGYFTNGLLSARPAAGIVDRFYFATDESVLYRDSGSAWTAVNPRARTLVATLPSSPYDGQEIVFQAEPTAGTLWTFRYRAASGAAYKWESVGQAADLLSTVATEEFAGAGWIDLGTVGPQIVVPVAGDWDYHMGARVATASSANGLMAQFGLSVANATPAVQHTADLQGVTNQVTTEAISGRLTAVPSGTTLKMRYNNNGNGAPTFARRWLRVRPVRVG